MYYSVSLMMIL